MDYKEQIKSPKWQKKRLQILELHNYTCEICGDTETQLHVHHSRYIKGRKIYEYDNDVLMCVCEKCHNEIHNKNKEVKEEKIYPKYLSELIDLMIERLEKDQYAEFYHFILAIVEYKYSKCDIINFLPQIYVSDGELELFISYCKTRNQIIRLENKLSELEGII